MEVSTILEAYKQADYFLLAAPLYIFSFPATVKNVNLIVIQKLC